MTRKVGNSRGLGKSIQKSQTRRREDLRKAYEASAFTGLAEGQASRSVLEQSSLDDLVATVQLKKEQWAESYGETEIVTEGPVLLDKTRPLLEVENEAAEKREFVSIPRRPAWREGMTTEELAALESEAFIDWRRSLKGVEQEGGLIMTPYERNLDFWRQLWRCLERSDLIVQVLDARDPDFYFCQDLSRYLKELGGSKRLMLLVNKADFLTKEQRLAWEAHFSDRRIDAVFFSALHELQKLQKSQVTSAEDVAADPVDAAEPDNTDAADVPVPDSDEDELEETAAADDTSEDGPDETETAEAEDLDSEGIPEIEDVDDLGIADVARLLAEIRARLPGAAAEKHADATDTASRCGTVGFVGYPNVGKSTVINALVGAKKVGMSRTPGKTKHIQTLELPEWGFTLCDAPGLVFPSVVATRAHLVINNTVPLDDLRECFSPIQLIVQKIGFREILERYNCAAFVKEAAVASGDHVLDSAHTFLSAFALARNHVLWVGVPDENWAARKVLRDYVTGKLLHCEPPPRSAIEDAQQVDVSTAPAAREAETTVDGDDDFDLDEFIGDDCNSTVQPQLTKRAARKIHKQRMKGAPVQSGTSTMGAKVRSRGRAIPVG